MDDRELVEQAKSGSHEAFAILVKRYEKKVFHLAYQFTRDQAVADDLAQEVFIKAYCALPKFQFRSEFGTWLYRIVVNHIKDYLRKRTRAKEIAFPLREDNRLLEVDEWKKKEEAQIEEYRRTLVTQGLESLPRKYHLIITLRDIQGLSYGEIAEILKISPGTVDSRLHRARKLLRKKMASLLSHKGGGHEV
ncbi:MAG: sigma-70 family RNA polymerase sigma factor [Candidatus Aminicenantales bacterium]